MKNFQAQLIPPKSRVAVALSGGEDSVALLSVLLSLRAQNAWDVRAVHVEHGIRGERSLRDCEFVQSLCRDLSVPLKVFHVDVPTERQATGESIEECARRLRYDCLQAALDERFCDCVVTAHHLSDFAETVLLRLARGTGTSGICAIPPSSRNGRLLRPMLGVKKQEISDYVRKNAIPYVTDESNDDDAYARNAVRHKIAPELAKLYPEWESAVKRYADIAAEDAAYLSKTAAALLEKSCEDYVVHCGDRVLLRRAFSLALAEMGAQKDVSKAHYDALCDLAAGEAGREICLPSGITAVAEYGQVRLTATRPETTEFCVPFSPETLVLPHGTLKTKIVCKRNAKNLCFDLDKLPSGAIIRNRKEGDRFRPFGGGDKKLKEYLIDKKIPRARRNDFPVIAVDSRVYVVIGLEISEQLRIDETTRRIAQISYFTEAKKDA